MKAPTPPQLPTLTVVSTIELENDAVIEDVAASHAGADDDVRLAELTGCNFHHMELTGTFFETLSAVDVKFDNCELSGVSMMLDSRLLRVEFNNCRMSGFVGSTLKCQDVVFNQCKLDGANFRMSNWDRVEFRDCQLQDVDFMSATMKSVTFVGCRMSHTDFSRVKLQDVAFNSSELENIVGASSLVGATIGSNQVMPVALSLLSAMNVEIQD